MSHQVLARKWRPQGFADIVGQDHVVTALVNALRAERLHHAYLFSGTRGVGKTTIARVLAKALTCETGITAEPCGKCAACTAISEGRFVDLIEVDAASRTRVEDTRELLENVQYAPTSGRFKIYLIDEVHMLSGHSFNALLKTLEEPPEHVKFLLATTDPQKLPVTVLSRCLQFTLRHISVEKIAGQLQHIVNTENLNAEAYALNQLADAADGSMRDALSLLDQAIAYSGGDLTEAAINEMLGTVPSEQIDALLRAISAFDTPNAMQIIQQLSTLNVDFNKLAEQLATILHAAAISQAVPEYLQHVNQHQTTIQHMMESVSPEDLQLFYQICLNCRKDLYLANTPRAGFEMSILRMIMFRPADSAQQPKTKRVLAKPSLKPEVVVKKVAAVNDPVDKQPAKSPVVDNSSSTNSLAASDNEWSAIIESLELTGVAQALATHCELSTQTDSCIELKLAPQHESLLVKAGVKKLEESLKAKFGNSFNVNIEVTDGYVDSPAHREQMVKDQKLQDAEQSLQEDSFVRALQSEFQAEIIPGSVQPTNK